MKKIILFPFKAIYFLLCVLFKVLYSFIKLPYFLLKFLFSKKQKEEIIADNTISMEEMFSKPELVEESPIVSKPQEAVTKVGNIIPIEEDSHLRSFRILNSEGELYKVDTSVPGPFYGPIWTKILSCYEARQTLKARIIRPILQNGMLTGYQVNIGNIETFMPRRYSMRSDTSQSINVRIGISHIDLNNYRVTVSAKLAYELLFARKPEPKPGEKVEAMYWDYDEEFVYFLLPGHYVGKVVYSDKEIEIAIRMGELTHCIVESVQEEEREALVTLPEPSLSFVSKSCCI